MDFSRFLRRFADVREDAGGYLVPCPAHDDGSPSLFLTLKDDGRMLAYCRAGCERGAVLEALGLKSRDLFGWRPGEGVKVTSAAQVAQGPGPGEIAGLRAWLDRQGFSSRAVDYARERFGLDHLTMDRLGLRSTGVGDPDPFPYISTRFRTYPRLVVPLVGFDGVARGAQGRDLSGECSARWVSLANTPGGNPDAPPITWAKYGVLRGGGEYGTYVVTEGPSDGLTAAAVGYDAVVVRGAGLVANAALVAELAEGMRGHDVVIAGDDDKAGHRFTAELGEKFREYGLAPRALRLPKGGDITDWRRANPAAFPAAFHKAIGEAPAVEAPRDAQEALRGRVLSKRTGSDEVTRDDGERAVQAYQDAVKRYGKTDAGRAYALVAFSGGTIRYSGGLGFYVWTGRTWEPSEARVRAACHRMGAALALVGEGEAAAGYLMTRGIDALLTELRSVPSVRVHASDFDARPELLTFLNCTVDLRTGVPHAHDPADMCSRLVKQDYDPDATAPRWEEFLREIFPEQETTMPDYLRRLIGYGITGETSEQAFAVLWGKGANGKSVFTDTLTHVFRDVSKTTPFATFEEKPSGGIPNDLAALRGARLVMASEGDAGRAMAESVLKRVTGADMISARFLRQEFFEFKPQFLLMLATNHKPRFKGQDDGLWRRVKLIHFARYFQAHERDQALHTTLLREAAGIVAWAVRGAQEWYREGLQDPDSIRDATKEYRETSDALSGFLPGTLVVDPEGTILGQDAYHAYAEWCEAEGLHARERWTRRGFYSAMEERGAVKHKTNKGLTLFGVRLSTPEAGASNPRDGETGRGVFA